MALSIFNDLQHICSLHFFSEFCHNICFFPPISDGVPSVVRLTAWDLSTLTLSSAPTRAVKISEYVIPQTPCDGQSVINSTDEYGRSCKICNIRAFINCNWKRNKLLYFAFQLAVQICQKIRNPICNCVSCQADICKSPMLFKAHNLCSLQHACLHRFILTKGFEASAISLWIK